MSEAQRARKARNSRERYARAVMVLPKMTLGEPEARALRAVQGRTGESIAGIVRRLIRESEPA